jgi:NAD-dependent deacetylase sirtuin 5
MTSRDLTSFHAHLLSSTRILAVCGAGLSAASGLPTFRGAGGMWRSHNALDLSTPAAFQKDPGMVWQFYSLRRHAALKARPNPAHYALAELSRRKGKQFLTLSQNVDGLSGMAGHPENGIEYLHGSLWNVRCARNWCGYARTDCEDPITEGLRVPKEAEGGEDVGWTDVGREELPGCPDCMFPIPPPRRERWCVCV